MNKEESKSSVSRQKKMTDKRIRLGLCPKCGEKQDRDGWYCSKCLKKRNSYLKESREFYSKIGICPICCKNKLFGDEKSCIECREKKRKTRKTTIKEEDRQKIREQKRNTYRIRKENGICTRCGKKKAAYGRTKCALCLKKDAQNHMKMDINPKEHYIKRMTAAHLCLDCKKPVDMENSKLCQSCWQKHHDIGVKNASENKYWRGYDKLIFKNF